MQPRAGSNSAIRRGAIDNRPSSWLLRRSAENSLGTALCSRTMFAIVPVLAPTPTHRAGAVGRPAARDAAGPDRARGHSLPSRRRGGTCCGWSSPRRFSAWRWRSRPGPTLRIAAETRALIRTMARENALWGAERIRGELLKLGIKANKRTVQKYMRAARPRPPGGQRWSTFLRNHACDGVKLNHIHSRPPLSV
jgi:hypothetical protein